MQRIVMFAVVLVVCGVSAKAQSGYPKAEIFGGYSYLNVEGEDTLGVDRQSLHGVGFSLAGNLSKRIGITGDFSYNVKNNIEVGPFNVDLNAFYFLFGPRFSWRSDSKATPFVHALAGGVRSKTHLTGFGAQRETDFAMGFGGGLDVKVNKTIAIRAFQADYLPTRIDAPFGDKKWAHHFRAQAGVVFNFGAD